MCIMPLVPETKMADAHKQSVSGNHWPVEPRDHCLKLCPLLNFVPRFMEPTLRHVFSINTSSSNTLPLFHIFTCRATHSFQCDYQREYYHSLIFTNSRQTPKNVYDMQTFLSSIYLVCETFSILENSNCVESQKETNI